MNRIITFLFIISSVFPIRAQNLSDAGSPQHRYSWNGTPGTESYQSAVTSAEEPNHFTPVWTGNGLDQMNINVVSATIDGIDLEAGDEIAVFDGNLCVGMGKLSGVIDSEHMLNIKASRDDGSGNGYTPGHPVVYKFWDQSAGTEIVPVTAFYYTGNPSWSSSGNFVIDGTAFVELSRTAYVTQSIDLISGWNIFSVYLTPDSTDLKTVFKSLINDGSLIKVQDENGNSLEDYGIFGGWTNNIGSISFREGYKIKVSGNCRLQIEGAPVVLPVDIPLKPGWNIVGYPGRYETNGLMQVQQLINRNSLVKMQDEKGNSLEDYGYFGGWTNNIGRLKPGEGYKIKVTGQETLTIEKPNLSPLMPGNPTPADSAQRIARISALNWECSDPEGDPLTCDVNLGISPGSLSLVSGGQTGTYYTPPSPLSFGTTYYWSVTVSDGKGNTTQGPVWRFTVANETGAFTDLRDTTTYRWVKIGSQVWMAQNLAFLPAVSPPTEDSYTSPYYYVYDYTGGDVSAAKQTTAYRDHGVLYNTSAALTACPAGWHLPSDAEWKKMEMTLGMLQSDADASDWRGTDEGTGLKVSNGWDNNGNGTDFTSFSAFPAGRRHYSDSFNGMGSLTFYWTGSSEDWTNSWCRSLSADHTGINRGLSAGEQGYSVRCLKDKITAPSVTTFQPDSITWNSAIVGGEVMDDGGNSITERGVCYSTTLPPTIQDQKLDFHGGTGGFRGVITGLKANTTWYARAYATNSIGTSYGEEVKIRTLTEYPSGNFTDARDGKTYRWIQKGSQVWMAGNLAWLPSVSPVTEESSTEPVYYVNTYNGTDVSDAKNSWYYNTCGVLYNWSAALTACPAGWHLPADDEWKLLEMALGISQEEADNPGLRGTNQGLQMKSTTGWQYDGNGTDTFGFTGLPGGCRFSDALFLVFGYDGYWWSSSGSMDDKAWIRHLSNGFSGVNRALNEKDYGFSVRCVKDHVNQ